MPPLPLRFHPDARYVARKALAFFGRPVAVGEPVTAEMCGGLRALERLYMHRKVVFAEGAPKAGAKPVSGAPSAGAAASMVVPPASPTASGGPESAPGGAESGEGEVKPAQEPGDEGKGAADAPQEGGNSEAGEGAEKAENQPVQGQAEEPAKGSGETAERVPVPPLKAVHKGFGNWYIEDSTGATVQGPMTKEEAKAIAP